MAMTTEPAARDAFIAGLRDLATFLAANPAVAVPMHDPEIRLTPYGTDDECKQAVDAFAEATDVPVLDLRTESGRYDAARAFGPVSYVAFTYTAAALAASAARYSYASCIQVDPPTAHGAGAIAEAA